MAMVAVPLLPATVMAGADPVQRCGTAAIKGSSKVLVAYDKNAAVCAKGVTKGKESDFQVCLEADAKGKVSKAAARLDAGLDKFACGPYCPMACPEPCETTTAGGATAGVDDAAELKACLSCLDTALETGGGGTHSSFDGLHNRVLYGVTLAAPAEKSLGKCQSSLAKSYAKLLDAALKQAASCMTKALRSGTIPTSCVTDDGKGKIAKASAKLDAAVNKCDPALGAPLDAGACAGIANGALAACLKAEALCRYCRWADTVGCVTADCDLFDDGSANASCATPGLAVCGNGILESAAGEQCDDGNTSVGDGCDDSCITEVCGNGIVQAGEQCDDGNTANDDACLNDCRLATCGDGIVYSGVEQCDDGNTIDGDCCSSLCQFETSGSACAADANECTFDVCDGAGTCVHPPADGQSCDDGNQCTVSDTCTAGQCAGTPVGANCKLVFATSSSYSPNFGGVAGADAICQAVANTAGYPGSFVAWLSSASVNARDRFDPVAGPYVRTDGVIVANDLADLTDGSLAAPLACDENQVCSHFLISAWTATGADGTWAGSSDCAGWTSANAADMGYFGVMTVTDSRWTLFSLNPCNAMTRLYCVQQ